MGLDPWYGPAMTGDGIQTNETRHEAQRGHGPGGKLVPLAFGALGVVFGDIGTSPLYAFKECVRGPHGAMTAREDVLGILSLITLAIVLVVAMKYLTFVMRADNRGEGGILALLALAPERMRPSGTALGGIAVLVLFGAALLYGDGIITPAISVLSAVEGLEIATDQLKPWVVPLTCGVLFGLFYIQKRGTAVMGKLFGPVMLLWFGALAVLGTHQIVQEPGVLAALSPHHAIVFFQHHGWKGFAVLGSVVLAITGGEALYADMGHFGRSPIRVSWYGLVMPALLLNYFGQGALLLREPGTSHPFYALVPAGAWTYALVLLATAATIIASQALISGAFSLTQQAVQLGFFPRVTIRHTSSEAEGQIYIPEINWALALACVALVLAFRESSKLAAAYGIAVTGTMAITSVAWFVVVRYSWNWPLWKALPLLGLFLAIDLPFLGANALKIADGGYVPLIVGAAIFVVMANWKVGRAVLADFMSRKAESSTSFLRRIETQPPVRVPGCAVFMTSNASGIPPVVLHHVKFNQVLHETVILLTILTEHVPKVAQDERLRIETVGMGIHRVVARFGFMEHPNVPEVLRAAMGQGLGVDLNVATYYIGRETFLATNAGRMNQAAESLFAFVSRNAPTATTYFAIPTDRVVEVGIQIDL